MRRFYIYTNMYETLLDAEQEIIQKYNLVNEAYEIDVFDEHDRLITTLHNRSTINQ